MRKTIEKLCTLINYLEDIGCLSEEDSQNYAAIMTEFNSKKEDIEELIEYLKGEYDLDQCFGDHDYIKTSKRRLALLTIEEPEEESWFGDLDKNKNEDVNFNWE